MNATAALAVLAGLVVAPARGEERSVPQGRLVTMTSLLDEMIDRDALARWPEPAYQAKRSR